METLFRILVVHARPFADRDPAFPACRLTPLPKPSAMLTGKWTVMKQESVKLDMKIVWPIVL